MRFAHKVQVFAVLLCVCCGAWADTLKTPAEARQLTDRVMAKVGEGDIEGGLRLTAPFLVISPAELDAAIGQIKVQLPSMSQRFGKSIGAEFIREDRVGDNLIRIVQLHRFEKHVMRWNFYFYRGKSGWVLNTFKTDDDIRQLFPQ
jgi:hypothetical protein